MAETQLTQMPKNTLAVCAAADTESETKQLVYENLPAVPNMSSIVKFQQYKGGVHRFVPAADALSFLSDERTLDGEVLEKISRDTYWVLCDTFGLCENASFDKIIQEGDLLDDEEVAVYLLEKYTEYISKYKEDWVNHVHCMNSDRRMFQFSGVLNRFEFNLSRPNQSKELDEFTLEKVSAGLTASVSLSALKGENGKPISYSQAAVRLLMRICCVRNFIKAQIRRFSSSDEFTGNITDINFADAKKKYISMLKSGDCFIYPSFEKQVTVNERLKQEKGLKKDKQVFPLFNGSFLTDSDNYKKYEGCAYPGLTTRMYIIPKGNNARAVKGSKVSFSNDKDVGDFGEFDIADMENEKGLSTFVKMKKDSTPNIASVRGLVTYPNITINVPTKKGSYCPATLSTDALQAMLDTYPQSVVVTCNICLPSETSATVYASCVNITVRGILSGGESTGDDCSYEKMLSQKKKKQSQQENHEEPPPADGNDHKNDKGTHSINGKQPRKRPFQDDDDDEE